MFFKLHKTFNNDGVASYVQYLRLLVLNIAGKQIIVHFPWGLLAFNRDLTSHSRAPDKRGKGYFSIDFLEFCIEN